MSGEGARIFVKNLYAVPKTLVARWILTILFLFIQICSVLSGAFGHIHDRRYADDLLEDAAEQVDAAEPQLFGDFRHIEVVQLDQLPGFFDPDNAMVLQGRNAVFLRKQTAEIIGAEGSGMGDFFQGDLPVHIFVDVISRFFQGFLVDQERAVFFRPDAAEQVDQDFDEEGLFVHPVKHFLVRMFIDQAYEQLLDDFVVIERQFVGQVEIGIAGDVLAEKRMIFRGDFFERLAVHVNLRAVVPVEEVEMDMGLVEVVAFGGPHGMGNLGLQEEDVSRPGRIFHSVDGKNAFPVLDVNQFVIENDPFGKYPVHLGFVIPGHADIRRDGPDFFRQFAHPASSS